MEKFNESLSFDKRMWAEVRRASRALPPPAAARPPRSRLPPRAAQDIRGSQAYARALCVAGLLSAEERDSLVSGLGRVGEEWAAGTFLIVDGDEDIHMANERRLSELVGAVGGKLHTGRSRNDQVATDTRLWLLGQLRGLRGHLRTLIGVALERAEGESEVLMPGFTHLQSAQTVRWSHWLLAHAAAWQRDDERLGEVMARLARLPLGSGALAGNPFGVDRRALAAELGFTGGVCPNSMDAVSDRDYVAETQFWASLCMTHLSRFAEDLIIYSSLQFGYVQLSDAYSTGSSLMPQKKNPDALELLRGKAGRLLGNLTGTLAVLKGTPSTYNKDFQEAWPPLFESVDAMGDCLQIAAGCLATLRLNRQRMAASLSFDMLATDLAEYLVRKGVPFRDTHHVAGAAVRAAEEAGVQLSQLPLERLRQLHPAFEADVAGLWSFERSAESRDTEGGTSLRSVAEQIGKLRAYLAAHADE